MLAVVPALLLAALSACAGAAPEAASPPRPEPATSASDGEVLGAHRQAPGDTLDASLTTAHPAPTSPHAEKPEAEAAHERLEEEECIAENEAAAQGADGSKRRVCPKQEDTPPPQP